MSLKVTYLKLYILLKVEFYLPLKRPWVLCALVTTTSQDWKSSTHLQKQFTILVVSDSSITLHGWRLLLTSQTQDCPNLYRRLLILPIRFLKDGKLKLGVIAHICKPALWETEARFQVQAQPAQLKGHETFQQNKKKGLGI